MLMEMIPMTRLIRGFKIRAIKIQIYRFFQTPEFFLSLLLAVYQRKEMRTEIDNYFDQKEEPVRGCLSAMRNLILTLSPGISEVWRYRMPFYCIHGNRFCYLWVDKKRRQPYIGFVNGGQMDHSALLSEKRAKMKIYLLDPYLDWDPDEISGLLKQAISMAR
jgi:hypothetical protein